MMREKHDAFDSILSWMHAFVMEARPFAQASAFSMSLRNSSGVVLGV
jgi:hypothetical protein